MKRIAIYTAAASLALAGSALMGAGAQASTLGATEHCDSTAFPNKVEANAGTSVYTGLNPGTVVCIKAGTKTMTTTVDANGYITQDVIMNKPGNAYLGISYYAYGRGSGCPSC
ncbi:MAG TPA: hypothetical protein VK899_10670 [Gemmatimonadales bacterium]|nr:hypothetical protein [Gemmatimonadales bacterium]